MEKIREAMAALKAEARAGAEQAKAEGKDHPGVPEERRSATSPMLSPASCLHREAGTSSRRTIARPWWTALTR